ncbi:MAG TPA: hypothetical protein VG826_28195 [Pirellulales bacterium]|nr:hypothetical protein [Pirellulales bacterium]
MPTHEIFQNPFPVTIEFEEVGTPESYRHWPGGVELGEKMKVWKVQNKEFPEIDPGLVSDPYGFDDSPDAEAISSGINSKGPEAVALGRHGNFFLWGFSAQPSDMTESGRHCFLNAICYIKKFDGQSPLVRKTSQGRRWALVYAGYAKTYGDQDFVKNLFPKSLREEFGTDSDRYVKYYQDNLEYLHPGEHGFEVDDEVKQLGVSNRQIELLDRCVKMLEDRDHAELAQRILKRYTTENFKEPAQWRAWLEQHRERLFFTDAGGYKFLVNSQSLQRTTEKTSTTGGR